MPDKIVHLTSVHRPFDIRIFHKECKTLVQAGYEVVLIAPHDRDEMVDRVQIRAVPKPKGRLVRMTRTAWEVYRAAIREDAHMYHFHDPELMSVGMLLKLRGKRVIWDIHEDLPRQTLTKDWISGGLRGFIARAAEVMEALCERNVDAIVAATPTIARRFTLEKTVTVQNLPTLDKPIHTKASPYMQRRRILAYVGGMSVIRGAREMVAAMNLLPVSLEAQLVLAGAFTSPKLEAELQQTPGWERVQFVGWKSQSEVSDLLAQSRVGLVVLHPAPNHIEALPNKLFEYMRAGIPVIASNFPLWRRIVEKERCGLLVNPLEPRAIAQAMQWILENPQQAEAMGKHGQEAVSARYNWGTEARELLELYGRLVK